MSEKPKAHEVPAKDSHPSVPQEPAPAILEDLFKCILGPLAATHIAPLLVEPEHFEERVLVLAQTFNANPEWKEPFRLLIKSLHTQETEISLEEQIRFFTTKHTRFWLIANLFNRILKLKELTLDMATGRMPAKPNDILKYAYKAREDFGEESRYKDLVFAAGIIFDFLFYLQKTTYLNIGQAKFDEPINQAFTRAVEQGKKITQLSRHKAKLSLEKLTPITPFMRQLSQLVLTLLKPEAAEFYKKFETTKPTEPLRLALEMKQFGVHTGIVSAYIAQSMPAFEHLGEVMSVWGFPYLAWVHSKKDIHDATGMGMLGVGIAEGLKGDHFGKAGKPAVGMPELRYLEFDLTPEVKSEIKI